MGYFEEIYTLEDIVVFKAIFLIKRIFTFFSLILKNQYIYLEWNMYTQFIIRYKILSQDFYLFKSYKLRAKNFQILFINSTMKRWDGQEAINNYL